MAVVRKADRFGGFAVPPNPDRQSVGRRAVLYFITSGEFVKIGITENLERRVNEVRLFNPHPLVVKSRGIPGSLARQVERDVHAALSAHSLGREWFRIAAVEAIAIAKPIIARANRAAGNMHKDGRLLGAQQTQGVQQGSWNG